MNGKTKIILWVMSTAGAVFFSLIGINYSAIQSLGRQKADIREISELRQDVREIRDLVWQVLQNQIKEGDR